MKRNYIIMFILSILLGAVAGRVIYKYADETNAIRYNSYIIEYGVYEDANTAKKAASKVDRSTIVYKDNLYYVYVGISTNYDNAKKIESAFNEQDIDVTIEETIIDNVEFISNLEQYDVLLDGVSSNKDVMSITDVILSTFEEIVIQEGN